MRFHVHPQTDELHAFGTKPHALLESTFAGQKNLSVSTNNAMPRQTFRGSVQGPRDLSRRTRISGGVCNVSVSGDLAFGNTTHLREKIGEHGARDRHRKV